MQQWSVPKDKSLNPGTNTCLHFLEMYVGGEPMKILYVSEIEHLIGLGGIRVWARTYKRDMP